MNTLDQLLENLPLGEDVQLFIGGGVVSGILTERDAATMTLRFELGRTVQDHIVLTSSVQALTLTTIRTI